jgi:hypothetical protein
MRHDAAMNSDMSSTGCRTFISSVPDRASRPADGVEPLAPLADTEQRSLAHRAVGELDPG